jgi:CRISPR-associated endonuclease/helicase Cas3
LGKTAVIAVWLLALANGAKVPRRLVYVVNRRTVVDQTTIEVERYKSQGDPHLPHFVVSTLRGQFADNREWSADPSRPAIICGTVDMIGSRLLFNGYGVGMKAKPVHAGFLGQDTLIIHDEAHLETAFQKLIESIRDEQARCNDIRPLRVIELTATSRGQTEKFGLTQADYDHPVVNQRINAKKKLQRTPIADPKKVAEQLAAKALKFADKNCAVLIYTSNVEDVLRVAGKLPKDRVLTLTGTMRGKERDRLVGHPKSQRLFARTVN